VQKKSLTAGDGALNDKFGCSVAIHDDTLVVGAYSHDSISSGSSSYLYSGNGSVYVYIRSRSDTLGITWNLQAKLTASDARQNDRYGFSVAILDETVVIGAPRQAFGKIGDDSAGKAYVFIRSGSIWTEQTILFPEEVYGVEFGVSVAISDDSVVVGAHPANQNSGSAYVFVRSGTAWSRQSMLIARDGAADDGFGASVAIDVDTIVVGAPTNPSCTSITYPNNTASAYVFTRSGANWTEEAILTANDGSASYGFGSSLAMDADTIVVGDPYGSSVHVFIRSGLSWSLQVNLQGPFFASDRFGNSVAIDEDTLVVGERLDNNDKMTRAVHTFIFDLAPPGRSKLSQLPLMELRVITLVQVWQSRASRLSLVLKKTLTTTSSVGAPTSTSCYSFKAAISVGSRRIVDKNFSFIAFCYCTVEVPRITIFCFGEKAASSLKFTEELCRI